ncbi:MAG TPA: radical SAM family heme chaperone HemW [Pyrinomonadaceae bacterium]|nr:radical SAM family heme chaperone HemW [Pyrinomonadaceae bacterium]
MTAGVYLHIPFCKSRCSYCDFATDVYRESGAVERYVAALCREIRQFPPQNDADDANLTGGVDLRDLRSSAAASLLTVDTIYFGGGTPSLLTVPQLRRILDAVKTRFEVADDAEITLEMNPATVTPESLAGYLDAGVNRASFGVQTFNDRDLKLLARGHDANDARNTFKMLRGAGFSNISFDLIIGLPGQTLDDWQRNLDEALKLDSEHLSLYILEIHEATPLAEQIRSGRRPLPDEELAAEMYEHLVDRIATTSFEQYEISNFAKPGLASRHNTKYWQLEPVYGFGVSAHSFDGRTRFWNIRDTAEYVSAIENGHSPEAGRDLLDDEKLAGERAFLGMRLTDGISVNDYERATGIDLKAKYASELERLADAGLIEFTGDSLKLTRRGMLFSNEVFSIFA